MSLLLAVDTSTQWTGLALYDGARVLGEMTWLTRGHHTVETAPAIQRLLEQSGTRMEQIDCFAAALGPGSFTSLRIGLALVKGMALTLRKPIVGIPTLDFLAEALPVQEFPLAAVLQAGRGRLALVWYRAVKGRWKAQGEPQIITAAALAEQIQEPTLVAGELTPEERNLLQRKRGNVLLASPALSTRRPSFLAELAWERFQAGRVDDPISLAPIYLHVGEVIPS